MTEAQRGRFVDATKGMYNDLDTYFSPGLLGQLKNGWKH